MTQPINESMNKKHLNRLKSRRLVWTKADLPSEKERLAIFEEIGYVLNLTRKIHRAILAEQAQPTLN